MGGWVDLGGWLYQDGLPAQRRLPIQVLTGPDIDKLRWSRLDQPATTKPGHHKVEDRIEQDGICAEVWEMGIYKNRNFDQLSLWLYFTMFFRFVSLLMLSSVITEDDDELIDDDDVVKFIVVDRWRGIKRTLLLVPAAAAHQLMWDASARRVGDVTGSATRPNCVGSSRRMHHAVTGPDVSLLMVVPSCALSRGIPSTRRISAGRSTPPDCVRMDRAATSSITTTTAGSPVTLLYVWNRFERRWRTIIWSWEKSNSRFLGSFFWYLIRQFLAGFHVLSRLDSTCTRWLRPRASSDWRTTFPSPAAAVLPAVRNRLCDLRAPVTCSRGPWSNNLQMNRILPYSGIE